MLSQTHELNNFQTATPTQNHRVFFAKRARFATQEKTSENPQPKCFLNICLDWFDLYISYRIRKTIIWWKRSSFAQHLPPRSRLAIWSIRQRGRFSISTDPWSMCFLKLAQKNISTYPLIYVHVLFSTSTFPSKFPELTWFLSQTSRTSKVMVSAPSEWQDWCIANQPRGLQMIQLSSRLWGMSAQVPTSSL